MKLLSLFIIVFLNFTLVAQAFSDVSDSDYQESIEALEALGVINGYADGQFRPLQSVNRAELLKIIFQALDEEASDYQGNCFPDVTNEWFAPFVCKAKDQGIIRGYDDGMYRPGQGVNMVEALKIAAEAFEMPIRDLGQGEQWFEGYVDFAHLNNLFSKYAYLPSRPMRREEVAFLVHKMLEIRNEGGNVADERDVRSAGCGLNEPTVSPTSFMVGGVQRSAITVIPNSYNEDIPISLVFAFHGRTNSNQQVKGYYRVEQASQEQAIFVYPAGLQSGSSYSWSDGGDSAGELRDYEFFDVMVEEFLNSYCVNVDEIYVVGHSLGGWFTNSLACARGDVIRGVASLGGGRSQSNCSGPVAVMQWHNPKDQLASFASGVSARDRFLEQNQCSQETKVVSPSWGNCVLYQGCHEFSPVVWCPHTNDYDQNGKYYTHNWPRGVGEEMWKFLSSLPD